MNRIKSIKNQISYQEKTVLITGGTRNIGLNIALELAKMNFNVVICGRTEKSTEKRKETIFDAE